jgi:hypothetical protein
MKIEEIKQNTNTTKITFSDIDLISKFKNSISCYYSYNTLIAIRDIDNIYYVSENIYSTTTGKYLNTIEPNKDNRLRRDLFEKKVETILNRIIFNPYRSYD